MALDTTGDAWQNADTQKQGKTDNKTDVDTESVIKALSDLESGKAYSTVELYNYVVQGDLESDNEPSSDDLRSFVPIYNALTTKQGKLRAKYRKQAEISDELEFKRKRVGDSGYENWYFGLVPNEG